MWHPQCRVSRSGFPHISHGSCPWTYFQDYHSINRLSSGHWLLYFVFLGQLTYLSSLTNQGRRLIHLRCQRAGRLSRFCLMMHCSEGVELLDLKSDAALQTKLCFNLILFYYSVFWWSMKVSSIHFVGFLSISQRTPWSLYKYHACFKISSQLWWD